MTVLGTGAVGTAVIYRLAGFDTTPLAVGRRDLTDYPPLAKLVPPGCYFRTGELTNAVARSAALIVCCPLTEQTRGVVGREVLAALPAGGYLVNLARGPVVDYTALRDALRSGQLAGAGLDVAWDEPIDPADELLTSNVTVTPHVGGVTRESYAAMAAAFATNVKKLHTGEHLDHLAT